MPLPSQTCRPSQNATIHDHVVCRLLRVRAADEQLDVSGVPELADAVAVGRAWWGRWDMRKGAVPR